MFLFGLFVGFLAGVLITAGLVLYALGVWDKKEN